MMQFVMIMRCSLKGRSNDTTLLTTGRRSKTVHSLVTTLIDLFHPSLLLSYITINTVDESRHGGGNLQ
jgi:hypothetical protein